MASTDVKGVARQYFERFNQRDWDGLSRIVAADLQDHTAMPGLAPGFEGLREFLETLLAAFPDLEVTVEDLIAEGDMVVARFSAAGTHTGELMGVPPSGRRVQFDGIDIFRVSDGVIVELWGKEDLLGLMQQIGGLPT